MSLVTLLITLIVVGVLLYCINRFIPMDATVKNILNIAVIIILILWLLKVFGVLDYASGIKL